MLNLTTEGLRRAIPLGRGNCSSKALILAFQAVTVVLP